VNGKELLRRVAALALPVLPGCGARVAATDNTPAQVSTPVASAEVQAPAAPLAYFPRGNCVVTDDSVDVPVTMALHPGGPPIATWQQPPHLTLVLDGRPEGPVPLKASGGGVALRTPWDPARLPLHLRRATALKGILTPLAQRPLTWLSSRQGLATLRYEAGPSFEHLIVDAEVECGLLALHVGQYEAQDAGAQAPVASQGYLKQDVDIDVRAAPDRPPVARVKLANLGEGGVTIHGRSGDLVEIRLETDDEVLAGWVASDALAVGPPAFSGIAGMGTGGMGYGANLRMKRPMHWVSCDRDIAVHAEAGGERGVVGELIPTGRFEAGAHHDGWVVVDFWLPWIVPRDGVFLVREEDFAHCRADRRQ
jgi:hypothetical protein